MDGGKLLRGGFANYEIWNVCKTAGLLAFANYETHGFAISEKHINYVESICKLCNSIEMLRGGLAKGFANAPF